MEKENLISRYLYVILILVVVFSIINVFVLQSRLSNVKEETEIAKERLKPAELEVIKLLSDCNNCYDIENALTDLKKQNVYIKKEQTLNINSQEAQELIKKYGIEKLPTIVISGDINKEQLTQYMQKIGELKEDAVVYTAINPPYYDNNLNKIVGKVSIINIIDSSCSECTKLDTFSNVLKKVGVFIKDEKSVEYNSQEGKELIQKFGIKHVPAVLISNDINFYPSIQEQLIQLDAKEKNGFYATHSTIPPYRNLTSDKIVGLVNLIIIKDSSCNQCYDVSVNKQILLRFGMYIDKENTYDITSKEGKDLIAKYKITKVPIIIVSSDAAVYSSFVKAWDDVGSIENDGWYIMRNPELLGTYKDLTTNKIVEKNNGQ